MVNDALEPGAGFEVDCLALVGRNGPARILPIQSKHVCRRGYLDGAEESLG